jgi:hypothetical protein
MSGRRASFGGDGLGCAGLEGLVPRVAGVVAVGVVWDAEGSV